jgi:hypothetical protein
MGCDYPSRQRGFDYRLHNHVAFLSLGLESCELHTVAHAVAACVDLENGRAALQKYFSGW